MTQTKKWILLALGLIVVLALAFWGYQALAGQYQADAGAPAQSPSPAAQDAATVAPDGSSGTPAPTATPMPAPDFSVLDGEGNTVSLSDFAGKPVVINFWATWCGPCRSELGAFDAAHKAYGDDIAFMMVNLTDGSRETVDGVKSFVKDAGYGFPVYYDATLAAAGTYGAYSIPLTVFVGADGSLLGGQIGAMSESALLQQLETMKGA